MTEFSELVAQEALAGLTQSRKMLPAKLLYDDEGCRLFGEITRLDEYYVTRTENLLLSQVAPKLRILDPVAVVEYGASDETKAELLFRFLDVRAYVPIDVAGQALLALKQRMALSRPAMITLPIEADFLEVLKLPIMSEPFLKFGFFPGSTIGNLDPEVAANFMKQVRITLGAESLFLIGVDLQKPLEILLPAYNDAKGVTAAFNINVLTRLNREADANFNIRTFQHKALWNEAYCRVEMHLESQIAQTAYVAGKAIRFTPGESIHTENSYKHTLDGFKTLADSAGWKTVQVWTDPHKLFSVHLCRAEDALF